MAGALELPLESDLHRFVSVRGVNLPEVGARERRFAFANLPNTYAAFDTAYPGPPQVPRPLLLVELPTLRSQANRAALMTRAVQHFIGTSALHMDEAALHAETPAAALRLVELWHRDKNRDRGLSPADFIARVDDALGMPVSAFVKLPGYALQKLRVWENLVAQYILSSTGNGALVARLNDMARWYWIIEKAAEQRIADGQEIYEAVHATVVLPPDVFHRDRERSPADEPDTREPAPDEDRKKGLARLQALDDARKELMLAYRDRAVDERHAARERESVTDSPSTRERPEPAALDMLEARALSALGASTQAVLKELDLVGAAGVNLPRALERIDNAHEALRDKVPDRVKTVPQVEVNGQLIRLDDMCHHYTPPDPCKPYRGERLPRGVGVMRPPGMADLRVIRSTLLKYERGELAHVENVLKGETKIREFNTLKRSEDTLVTEEETSTETERETQSTDRFEMEKEISSITKEDMKLDTGVKVTATYGPVSIDTHFNFQFNTSKEESNRVATKSAQETINRASSRVTEKRRQQRTVTTILQTEDKNRHELANGTGAGNIHGLYYWLDKYYLSKVVNYGKRLMFEFVVPEPAAFFLFASQQKAKGEKVPPVPPYLLGIYSLNEINDGNWSYLAAFYGAQDITPPPPTFVVIGTSLEHDRTPIGKDQEDADKEDIEFTVLDANEKLRVPSGYLAHHADVSFAIADSTSPKKVGVKCDGGILGTGILQHCHDVYENVQSFHILIGNRHLRPHSSWSPMTNIVLNTEDSVIPFAVSGRARHFAATVEVVCYRTEKRYKEWKNATFNALVSAFERKLDEYEDWQRTRDIGQGVSIEGNNPGINRKVEREELKKHCIEMMTGQRFETFDAMRSNVPSLGYPEFSFLEAHDEGQYLQFFEQAFEWEQMTYLFYPYFWGRKPNWVTIKKITDPDPIFSSFLQAGAARVLVPARPGFEEDVVAFFASGGLKIWGGKQAPIPGEEQWLPLVDELKEQQGQFQGGAQEGDAWIYKLPTTLVYLDDVNAALLDNSPKYPNDVAAAMKPRAGDFN